MPMTGGDSCTSFGRHSEDLSDAIAEVTRHLCKKYVDPDAIKSLMACRLIALNKNPGVRPIGVVETLRRIMGKAIMAIILKMFRKWQALPSFVHGKFQESNQQSMP